MKTTFDIQQLESLAHQYEASIESIRANAEAGAKAIVAEGERLAGEYQRMAEAHRLVIQSLQGTVDAASAVSSQIAVSASAFQEQIADALHRAALDSGVAVSASVGLAVRNLMDAGRWLIEAKAIPNEFDVGRFRDGIKSRFQEIADAVSDKNAYSKVLLKLAEEGEITVKERGRGRRPSTYEIASANGGDAM